MNFRKVIIKNAFIGWHCLFKRVSFIKQKWECWCFWWCFNKYFWEQTANSKPVLQNRLVVKILDPQHGVSCQKILLQGAERRTPNTKNRTSSLFMRRSFYWKCRKYFKFYLQFYIQSLCNVLKTQKLNKTSRRKNIRAFPHDRGVGLYFWGCRDSL